MPPAHSFEPIKVFGECRTDFLCRKQPRIGWYLPVFVSNLGRTGFVTEDTLIFGNGSTDARDILSLHRGGESSAVNAFSSACL
jgi:hypothetical protein